MPHQSHVSDKQVTPFPYTPVQTDNHLENVGRKLERTTKVLRKRNRAQSQKEEYTQTISLDEHLHFYFKVLACSFPE